MRLTGVSQHSRAVFQALFVTFLWSTSWVLIKIGLVDIPALTFAGLRYFLAFLALSAVYLYSRPQRPLRSLSRREWVSLLILGLLYYTVTQGTQFLGLVYLPAITFSLLLNSTAIIVAILGILLLRERPTWLQWCGAALFLVGALAFFYPLSIPNAQVVGYAIAMIHIMANSFSSVLGRSVNRNARIHPLTVTVVSMGIGSLTLLAIGLSVESLPALSPTNWVLVAWLAIVNTAFAFTLWNLTLRTLSAMESSIINNTMLIQITILAWLFLGESLTWLEVIGLVLAAIGAILVQLRSPERERPVPAHDH